MDSKNATALLGDLKDDFDFAVNEQCYAYGECGGYTSTFLAQNKPVFNQEYLDPDDAEGSVSKTTFQGAACTYFRGQQIASLWKSGLNLNGQGRRSVSALANLKSYPVWGVIIQVTTPLESLEGQKGYKHQ